MTRQRRWQIKMVRKGKRKICGAPAVTKFLCEKHRLAVNTRDREALHKRDSAKRRYAGAEYAGGKHATTYFTFLNGCWRRRFPAILPADRQLLLHAAQRREHSDRRWQIGRASCKALAARPNKSFSSKRKAHPTRSVQALSGMNTSSAEKISVLAPIDTNENPAFNTSPQGKREILRGDRNLL